MSFLPMDAIAEFGEPDLSRVRQVSEVKAGYSYFADGDVAFAKVTPCFENGKGALFRGLEAGMGFGTTELTVLRPKHSQSARFLSYVLQSAEFRNMGIASMTGAGGLKRVSEDAVRDFVTFWPELAAQERIANFLDDKTARIDALIAEKERLAERLLELHRATLWERVTKGVTSVALRSSGVEWIGDCPSHWQVKAIKWITPVLRGASPRPIDDPKYFDDEGEYGWVRIADVSASNGLLTETEQQLSVLGASLSVKREPGDLFLSIAGTVGKPCVAGIKCCIHDGFVWFPTVGRGLLRDWLFAIFESGFAYAGLGKMGTQLNLNTDTVGSIRIPLPPEAEMASILECLAAAKAANHRLRKHVESHIERLREYRSSLISAAVTGRLDVGSSEASRA